jgi:hypothetical protein
MRWSVLLLGLFFVSIVVAQSGTRVDFIIEEDDGVRDSYVSNLGFWDLYWSYVFIVVIALIVVIASVKLKKKAAKRKGRVLKKKK